MSVDRYANCVLRAPGQDNFRNRPRVRFRFYRGFTLIELLVVIAIIAILAAILFPVFSAAKESGRQAKCSAQLKQLLAAIISYTDDNNGRYVPAAKDMYLSSPYGGYCRWHGARANAASDFDPKNGPLWDYLARSGGLKQCPSANLKTKEDFTGTSKLLAYESGSGGYGYNAAYVGGTFYRNTKPKCFQEASVISDINTPAKTVMLADVAMSRGIGTYIEESSIYTPQNIEYDPDTSTIMYTDNDTPSMHFRHNGRANVGWCDGHVTSRRMDFTSEENTYHANNAKAGLGFIGPRDNSLFDNK